MRFRRSTDVTISTYAVPIVTIVASRGANVTKGAETLSPTQPQFFAGAPATPLAKRLPRR